MTSPPIASPALAGLRRTRGAPWASRRRWLGANAVPIFCGVLILYLPLDLAAALILVAATLAGMTIALYATRRRTA